MRHFLTALGVIFGIAVFMFLDYSLPSKRTVRIIETYNKQTNLGLNGLFYAAPDTGTATNPTDRRDVLFINAVRPSGKIVVYRNEDTGWVWPPYFKYTSSDLQGRAADLRSIRGSEQWVSVTSYGWRISWASIYPNAISIKPVDGPNARPVNWGAQITLVVIGLFLFLIWRMWNQFRERTLQPAARSVDRAIDRADARADAARGRVGRWFDNLLGRKR